MRDVSLKFTKCVSALLLLSAGCAKLTTGELSKVTQISVYPLASYSADNSTIFKATTIPGYQSITDVTRWSLVADGRQRGVFTMSNGTASLIRSETPGPCDDGQSAPNCPMSWGNGGVGSYTFVNYSYYPNVDLIALPFSQIAAIDVDIMHQLMSGNLVGGISECGLSIALGSGQNPSFAPAASNNFAIRSRSAASGDVIRFQHRIQSGGAESVQIDTPINSSTDPSLNEWGTSVWSAFNVVTNNQLLQHDDYVKLHLRLEINNFLHQVKITLTPLETNKNLALMNSHSETWDYLSPQGTTVATEPRAGLALDTGSNPISLLDLLNARASVGFDGNGLVKKCEFTNLAISKLLP